MNKAPTDSSRTPDFSMVRQCALAVFEGTSPVALERKFTPSAWVVHVKGTLNSARSFFESLLDVMMVIEEIRPDRKTLKDLGVTWGSHKLLSAKVSFPGDFELHMSNSVKWGNAGGHGVKDYQGKLPLDTSTTTSDTLRTIRNDVLQTVRWFQSDYRSGRFADVIVPLASLEKTRESEFPVSVAAFSPELVTERPPPAASPRSFQWSRQATIVLAVGAGGLMGGLMLAASVDPLEPNASVGSAPDSFDASSLEERDAGSSLEDQGGPPSFRTRLQPNPGASAAAVSSMMASSTPEAALAEDVTVLLNDIEGLRRYVTSVSERLDRIASTAAELPEADREIAVRTTAEGIRTACSRASDTLARMQTRSRELRARGAASDPARSIGAALLDAEAAFGRLCRRP